MPASDGRGDDDGCGGDVSDVRGNRASMSESKTREQLRKRESGSGVRSRTQNRKSPCLNQGISRLWLCGKAKKK